MTLVSLLCTSHQVLRIYVSTLFKCSMISSSFSEGKSSLLQTSLFSGTRDSWNLILPVKTEAKIASRHWPFPCPSSTCSIQQPGHVFSCLPFVVNITVPFLLNFSSLARFNSNRALAFPVPSLHTRTVSPSYYHFYLLYASILCLCFVRISLFIFAGLLLTLQLGEGDPWKSISSPGPLLSPGLALMGFFPRRSQNKPLSALLKSGAVDPAFCLVPFCQDPWITQPQSVFSWLEVWGPTECLSPITFWQRLQELSSLHSRNFLSYMLSFHQILGWLLPHEDKAL